MPYTITSPVMINIFAPPPKANPSVRGQLELISLQRITYKQRCSKKSTEYLFNNANNAYDYGYNGED